MPLDLLAGLNVLDLGQGISAPFCARLFADLGARVVKVEPPGGDRSRREGPFPGDAPNPETSGLFLALNTNKLGITLNLETPAGRQLLLDLAAGSDLIVEDFPPDYLPGIGLGYPAFRQVNPRVVLTSVTPLGQTGPWAGFQANNLVVSNLSGHAREHPGPVESLSEQPPLQLAAHQGEFLAGLAAATAAMLALNRRSVTGSGCHVDACGVAALAVLPQTTLAEFSLGRPVKGRSRAEYPRQSLLALLPCRDGYVGISPRQQDQWERMVDLMGNPDWAGDPRFATRDSRLENWDTLEPLLIAWTGERNKEDVYRQCQGIHVPSFPLNTAADLFQSPQFIDRGFFIEVDHPAAGPQHHPGLPVSLGSGQRLKPSPAPMLGQDNLAVLGENGLGLNSGELAGLRAAGAI